MQNHEVEIYLEQGGGEMTLAAMEPGFRKYPGRQTFEFVWRCMRNPELRRKIQERAAQLDAQDAAAAAGM